MDWLSFAGGLVTAAIPIGYLLTKLHHQTTLADTLNSELLALHVKHSDKSEKKQLTEDAKVLLKDLLTNNKALVEIRVIDSDAIFLRSPKDLSR